MTTLSDKNEALATCFRNLKGAKTKDLLLTAQALRYLRELPEFPSNRRLGESLGVSGEIVRQFLALNDLPEAVQSHFAEGALGLEHGRRLWQLHRVRPELVEEAATAMTSLTAMETRDFVEFLLRVPSSSVPEARQALLDAKPRVSHEYHIDAVLDETQYTLLCSHATNKGLSINAIVSQIVSGWLADQK